jgi:hypothetical protein
MTEYMETAQKRLFCTVFAQLIQLSDGTRFFAGTKAGWEGGGKGTPKSVFSATAYVFALARSQSLYTSHAHMWSPHVTRRGTCSPVCMSRASYFFKETIWETWKREVYGYHIVGSFIKEPVVATYYIPDPYPLMFQGVGRRKKKRIRNNMDRSEASPDVRIC